jgi:2-hydroxychromene-2-carboxylate isomerase
MPVTIDYYMTLTSPWTYLGSAAFAEIAARNNATVNIKPCKFGPIFEQTGGLPLPKRSPQRRAYRMMELKRWREVLGIPINLEPKHFSLRRHRGDPPGDRGQAARQECPQAVAGTLPRGLGT